jgi:hypothetical protein
MVSLNKSYVIFAPDFKDIHDKIFYRSGHLLSYIAVFAPQKAVIGPK